MSSPPRTSATAAAGTCVETHMLSFRRRPVSNWSFHVRSSKTAVPVGDARNPPMRSSSFVNAERSAAHTVHDG